MIQVSRRRNCNIQEDSNADLVYQLPHGKTCMDEVAEVIRMPNFDAKAACTHNKGDCPKLEIAQNVIEQLKEFVTAIAFLYRHNQFHNFEHACHVTMR